MCCTLGEVRRGIPLRAICSQNIIHGWANRQRYIINALMKDCETHIQGIQSDSVVMAMLSHTHTHTHARTTGCCRETRKHCLWCLSDVITKSPIGKTTHTNIPEHTHFNHPQADFCRRCDAAVIISENRIKNKSTSLLPTN